MNIGDKAPEVLGINEQGKEILLSHYKGKKLVLYFYPKDNTSGCTAEACSLRDHYTELKAKDMEVMRAIYIIFIVVHIYWFCYRFIKSNS